MRIISILVALLLLSVAYAENSTYSKEYVVDNWLKVTRNIVVNDTLSGCNGAALTGVCGNTGAVVAQGTDTSTTTVVTLTVTNTGPIERNGIEIGESFSFVPEGAKITYLPQPTYNDGQKAVWSIAALKAGKARHWNTTFPRA